VSMLVTAIGECRQCPGSEHAGDSNRRVQTVSGQ